MCRRPVLIGATGWLNSEPLTRRASRKVVPSTSGRTRASTGCERSATSARGPRSTTIRARRGRSAHARVPVRTRRRQRSLGGEEMNVRYPIALDPDYAVWRAFDNHYWPARTSPTRKDESATTNSARVDTRSANEPSRCCCARPGATASPTISSPSPTTASRRKRTGRTWIARDVPRLSAGSELRVGRCRARRTGALAQPVDAPRGLDGREWSERVARGRWANRVSLPRARRQSRHGPA